MCGIACVISKSSFTDLSAVEKMLSTIKHRGPDDEGHALVSADGQIEFFSGVDSRKDLKEAFSYFPSKDISKAPNSTTYTVWMGHRRLNILDVSSAAHQPMCTPDRRYTIIFNGEIYNFEDIRTDLKGLGHVFQTLSDTEVILHAYQEWGAKCLDRFNGMFSFIIYDRLEDSFFAARDRFGEKPLYYWFDPHGLIAFASEIKQFTELTGWKAHLNHQMAFDFLKYGLTDHTSETLFQGVLQIPAGSYIHSKRQQLWPMPKVTTWYRLQAANHKMSFAEASQRFEALLLDSIRLRLRADVPVGTALSGGLDSSSIVTSVAEILRSQSVSGTQKTFSARASEKGIDEGDYIHAVVDRTGAIASETTPHLDELLKQLRKITWHQDEPFAGTSIFAEWEVFKLVKSRGVRVTLDGHGADEVVGGYPDFWVARIKGSLRRGEWFDSIKELYASRRSQFVTKRLVVRALLEAFLPDRWNASLKRRLSRGTDYKGFFKENKKSPIKDGLELESLSTNSSMQDLSIQQLKKMSLPVQLHWADRDSMAHSVESRLPFLDHRFAEFVLACPDQFKIRKGVTKAILREAMGKRLPDLVCQRQNKIGFATPEEEWMTSEHSGWFLERLKEVSVRCSGFIQPAAFEYAKKIIQKDEAFNRFAWRLISFGEWVETFNVQMEPM